VRDGALEQIVRVGRAEENEAEFLARALVPPRVRRRGAE